MNHDLMQYDIAMNALKAACSVDEVALIRDQAEALRVYYRHRKDLEGEMHMAEFKLRAGRKIGIMSKGLEKLKPVDHGPMAHGDLPSGGKVSKAATLKAAGISTSTSHRLEKLAEIPEEVIEDEYALAEKKQVPVTYLDIERRVGKDKKKKKNTAIAATPTEPLAGTYDVAVIDPPWPMEQISRDVRPNQVGIDYPVMQEEEIAALELPLADAAHIFLWTTQKFLPMALRILDAWGLKYVCTFVWHKPGGFQPFGLPQYNCEFALYARKGTPKFVDTKAFPLCFNAPRGSHSEKPQEFYDVVARVTDGKRIDIFNRRAIPGFDTWGNES
jgi:N6-adenosine-specific RNA methylase IME4